MAARLQDHYKVLFKGAQGIYMYIGSGLRVGGGGGGGGVRGGKEIWGISGYREGGWGEVTS